MNILFFFKGAPCFFNGFLFVFFNTLCGERMSNRMDILIQYCTPPVEPLADFCDVHDEDPSMRMKETKARERERGRQTTTGSDNFLCCSLAWPCVLLSCTHELK